MIDPTLLLCLVHLPHGEVARVAVAGRVDSWIVGKLLAAKGSIIVVLLFSSVGFVQLLETLPNFFVQVLHKDPSSFSCISIACLTNFCGVIVCEH